MLFLKNNQLISKQETIIMNEFYSNTTVTIKFDDVIKIIEENSLGEMLTRKCDILDELRLEDTKENRKLLTKVTDELKKRGIIYTVYGLNEDEPGYRGRGYVMDTRFSEEAKDEN